MKKHLSIAIALLSAPLFATTSTLPEAPRDAATLFLDGTEFQAENHGTNASWLVFSDRNGTILTTTQLPAGSELRADVPDFLLNELRVEVLTPTPQGIHHGERRLLSSLLPDPSTAMTLMYLGGETGQAFATHGDGPESGVTPIVPPPIITPPNPPL